MVWGSHFVFFMKYVMIVLKTSRDGRRSHDTPTAFPELSLSDK